MTQKAGCTIENCDIFDFMAKYVGMSVLHPGGFKATAELANACKINKNSKVIDIACGKGTTSLYLAEKYGCQVTGIDIDEELVNEAKNRAKLKGLDKFVRFCKGDAIDLQFSDNTFDVAISQAMLVLVRDKKKAIQEALRVIKPDGYAGWLELSWKEQPPQEFMDAVSNVICAYCMLNVETFQNWKSLFISAGAKEVNVSEFSLDFTGISGMITDEGILNSFKIMLTYLKDSRVRRRMKTLNDFIKSHPQYFGYGVYTCRKILS